jgi:hypothetical protein
MLFRQRNGSAGLYFQLVFADSAHKLGGSCPPQATHLLEDSLKPHREGGGLQQHTNQSETS